MVAHNVDNILLIKATLLSGATIQVAPEINPDGLDSTPTDTGYIDNHHGNPWIFLKISKSTRVRLTVYKDSAKFKLDRSDTNSNGYKITCIESNSLIADNVYIEKALVHCPKQLFLGLYEFCSAGCLFCPITGRKDKISYSIDEIMSDIASNEKEGFESIGITTGTPPHLSDADVGNELANIISQVRSRVGSKIPIGVSTKHPSRDILYKLKNAGADEIRLNLEVFNTCLAAKLMPNKNIIDIMASIKDACEIFGRGKVSSNLIVGIGESDTDVIAGVTELAKLGCIATLYPYDPIPDKDNLLNVATNGCVGIPSAQRLIHLAIKHKEILKNYKLDVPLKTMCPACAASHIMPGIDL